MSAGTKQTSELGERRFAPTPTAAHTDLRDVRLKRCSIYVSGRGDTLPGTAVGRAGPQRVLLAMLRAALAVRNANLMVGLTSASLHFCAQQCAALLHQHKSSGKSGSDGLDRSTQFGPTISTSKDGRTRTRPKLRQTTRWPPLPYSHSIISNDVSSLIYKQKLSSLTDKCRRYTRPNSSVLNSQKKLLLTKHWQFPYLSESIDWMARRVRKSRVTQLALAQSFGYRQRSGRDLLSRRHSARRAEPIQVRSAFKSRPLRQSRS
jgi:hypothetical protein